MYLGSIGWVQAQVKIGDNPTTLTPSALLELETSNRGILFPRVELNATTQAAMGATSPRQAVKGMVVYNLNAGVPGSATYPAFGEGVYFFDGTGWVYTGLPKGGTAGDVLVQTNTGISWQNITNVLPVGSLQIKTQDYTMLTTDDAILFDVSAEAAGITLTLPTASSEQGRKFKIGKIDDSTHPLLFSPTLKLAPGVNLATLNYARTFIIQSDGTDWWVVNQL